MKLAFNIAWRFLMSAKKQTLVIVLGIAVGVSVQVFIGSLISGLQKDLVDTAIGSTSQLTVESKADGTYITDANLVNDVRAYSDTFDYVTETFSVVGFLEKEATKKQVVFRGLDLVNGEGIYKFESGEKITYGRMPIAADEIMLGIGFFEEYKEKSINLFDESNPITVEIESQVLKGKAVFKVVGFFDLGVSALNNSWGIGSLEAVRSIDGVSSNIVSSIEMQLSDPFLAEELALGLQEKIGNTYQTSNWMVEQASLLSGLKGQSISSLMIQIFVIIAVVLGIASTLAITVIQKSRQIGILKAMGLRDKDASLVFLFEGAVLGVFGAIAGIILGVGLSFVFVNFAVDSITGDPVVPLFIDPSFIALSAFIALVAAILSALIPALRSSRMTVIEVIRNG